MAVGAAHGTALQENDKPHTRPVNGTEAFDGMYASLRIGWYICLHNNPPCFAEQNAISLEICPLVSR